MKDNEQELVIKRRRTVFVLLIALFVIGSTALDYLYSQDITADPDPLHLSEEQIKSSDSLVLATEALGKLAVKDRVSREGYSREQFSPGWATVAGCDMRNRILQRDLVEIELDDDDCTVLSGLLKKDPFTGKRIEFTRGIDTSRDIHIEHLVAVSDAWQKGAQDLSYEQRHDFFNDPLNLLAVDGPANMEKGDADAADWLPRTAYKCRYVARQIAIKLKHELWITPREHSAMSGVLGTCPMQVLPIETTIEDED